MLAAVSIAQTPDTRKVVVNTEMIKRFNECNFDSTKNFRYASNFLRTHTLTELQEFYAKKPEVLEYNQPQPKEQKPMKK